MQRKKWLNKIMEIYFLNRRFKLNMLQGRLTLIESLTNKKVIYLKKLQCFLLTIEPFSSLPFC